MQQSQQFKNVTYPVALFELVHPDAGHPVVAIDPVCRMQVAVDSAATTVKHSGRTYWFCSAHCANEFAAEPGLYAGESGCYSGATSCPAPQTINGVTNVRGTLMSYCHLLGGCSASAVFHPRTVEILDPIVASKEGVCVFPVAGANPKEASPAGTMTANRQTAATVAVNYTPACGATQHTT